MDMLRGIKVLVADDEEITTRMICHHLATAGMVPIVAVDGGEAIRLVADDIPVALIDLDMPQANGLQCLRHIRREHPDTQVVIVSGRGTIKDAVAAMKEGALDYVAKPIDPDELLTHVSRAVDTSRLQRENRDLRQAVSALPVVSEFAATTPAAKEVLNQVGKIAQVDSTVLIMGESGTGKSTLARLIHRHSRREAGPFIAVNCASLPRELIEAELFGHAKGAFTGAMADRPGRAEVANGGTLFLDEIGDLPLDLQPKLLTFLQDRTVQRIGSNKVVPVDVRVIVATHQDLAAMCAEKRFREDLFFRLSVLTLTIPPLRDRVDDIPSLAREIIRRIATRHGRTPPVVTDDAIHQLQKQPWPGNVRELENVLERALAFSETDAIDAEDLQFYSIRRPLEELRVERPQLAGSTLAELEKQAIVDTLQYCRGNKAMAARELGITEKTIYNKMKRHGLS